METRHATQVSALRAEMADMRAEIMRMTEVQAIAERPPLRLVASAADAAAPATPLDDALADLMQVVEQRGWVRAIRAMMALLGNLLDKEIVADDPGTEAGLPAGGGALH